jgi:hypothetical protein
MIQRGIALVEHRVGGFDSQFAALRHSVSRVDRQIEQRMLEFVAVDKARPQAAEKCRLDGDLLAQGPAQHIQHARDKAVGVDRLRIKRLAA